MRLTVNELPGVRCQTYYPDTNKIVVYQTSSNRGDKNVSKTGCLFCKIDFVSGMGLCFVVVLFGIFDVIIFDALDI